MKTVVYISDYLLHDKNSVRDILKSLVDNVEDVKTVLVKYEPVTNKKIHRTNKLNYILFRMDENKKGRFGRFAPVKGLINIGWRIQKKIMRLRNPFLNDCAEEEIRKAIIYQKIFHREKADLVLFLLYSPEPALTELCQKMNLPYVCILYDTYLSRPFLNKEAATQIEKSVILSSKGYFVPDFFYKEYDTYYQCEKVHSFKLPLLLDINKVKAVIAEESNNKFKYSFAYFGQLQSFRNVEKIREICRMENIMIDIFTTDDIDPDDVYRVHEAVDSEQLLHIVAQSQILVIFDNSIPYDKYLPSKVYLYVSFAKPILVFGDNSESAVIQFLKGYPYYYYYNIKSKENFLQDFLATIPDTFCFDDSVYNQYLDYLPDNALLGVNKTIESILKNNN